YISENLYFSPAVDEEIRKQHGVASQCKSGRSRLQELQKRCYSCGLGCYRKFREFPDISIAARTKRSPAETLASLKGLGSKSSAVIDPL
ncbi:hypothetical protein, partial [Achromobacter piechaudii]|uniref:hypothetical protein n=1 Tax=Achromobacter piechaudii TaxID=72556 RepID=UPI001C3F4B9C